MNIAYLSNSCSDAVLKKLSNTVSDIEHQPAIKLHRLIMQGLVMHDNINVDAICMPHVNIKTFKGKLLNIPNDCEDRITYYYLRIINIPIIKNIFVLIETIYFLKKILKNRKEMVLVCDILKTTLVLSTLIFCKLTHKKCVAIVTDVPSRREGDRKGLNKLEDILGTQLIKCFDGYVFVTEQANSLVNKNRKPYVIVECLADTKMGKYENFLENKRFPKVCLYAGSIREIYGIENLIHGFVSAGILNTELHFYGTGDYVSQLQKFCADYPTIKYKGVIPNEDILAKEIEATLLINPRPARGEYTKYSFPSKNMEYLATGTPMLGVKLPGIPEEYYRYMFILEDISIDVVAESLQTIFSLDSRALHRKGIIAKDFVLKEKNNFVLAGRIISVLETIQSTI